MYHDEQPHLLKRFWHFLTFKTHGDHLLTTSSASYLTGLSVIMLVVALTEAFAWGHFGANFSPENPFVGKLTTGMIAFCVIWFFDRMLVTQDLLAKEHAYTLEGHEKPNTILEKYKISSYLIFVVRLGIVVASIYVTSGFITQLVFKADIEKQMQSQYQNNIETAKQAIIGNFDQKIHEQEIYLKSLHEKLQKEIDGKRGTGYGKGAVAKSIENEITAFETTINTTKQERQNTENAINQAILSNDAQALKTFGIEAVKDSPIFRQQAVDKFSQDPAFKKTRLNLEIGLFLISLMLVLSKIFQSRDVQLYYSELLQEKWTNYKGGSYDKYLDDINKSTNLSKYPMPNTFEGIMIDYAKNKDRYKTEEQEAKKREQAEKEKEKQAEQKQQEQVKVLQESHQEWLERQARELQRIEYNTKQINHIKKQIQEAKATIKEKMDNFSQENSANIEALHNKRQQILEDIAETTRIYTSKKEDMQARQERLSNAKNKLGELQSISNSLEQKDKTTVGAVRTYQFTQDAIEEQKKVIKNLQDNYLTFERNINFYEQKIQNLHKQKSEIETKLRYLKEIWDTFKEEYYKQELLEIKLLSTIDLNTPYIHGSEAEIPYLAEKVKNEETYYYIDGVSKIKENSALEYKNE